jgi:hypothetical protein
MKLKDYTVKKVNKVKSDDGLCEYADFIITNTITGEQDLIADVLLPKSKRQVVEISDLGSCLED